jgi:hypothetical protein
MNKKAQQLQAQITNLVKSLAEQTNAVAISETMTAFLDTCSKFHQYSLQNLWCIWFACPHATRVAGYRAWNKFNRYVRKGEKGIPILAPMIYRKDPDDESSEKELRGFRVVYVFDVSQTDGEPLPEAPEWRSQERRLLLENRLVSFAQGKGIAVNREEIKDGAQGKSKGGTIVLAEDASTKVLIHEIAHELLHKHDRSQGRQVREIEAEAVAFVVAQHFGFEAETSSNYLALWEVESDKILARMDTIRKTAAEIINAVDPQEAAA